MLFSYSTPTFSTHIPQLFIIKVCFTSKANAICRGGQLLVSRSQCPISRVSDVRVPCPKVVSANSQDPASRVPGSHVLWSRVLVSQGPRLQDRRVLGPGSQVLILEYALQSLYNMQRLFILVLNLMSYVMYKSIN